MVTPTDLLFIFLLNGITFNDIESVNFTSITTFYWMYVHKLYLEEWNENKPSDFEQVTTDKSIQDRICKEIGSDLALQRHGRQVDIALAIVNIQRILEEPDYWKVKQRIYGPTPESDQPTLYGYRQLDFEVYRANLGPFNEPFPFHNKKEYVLVCWLEVESRNKIVPFYVSKAYNEDRGFGIHRFVILENETVDYYPLDEPQILLAEGPALDYKYIKPDFNIELHYIELRKRYQPVEDALYDPVCKINIGPIEEDATIRLCSMVFNSSRFKKKVKRVEPVLKWDCSKRIVSFRTEEGLREAGKRLYHEICIRCKVDMIDGDSKEFFISRAYNPNQVFVYSEISDFFGNKIMYLKNLSTNVCIIHERYDFGNVEI